jgi:hypothetical protein
MGSYGARAQPLGVHIVSGHDISEKLTFFFKPTQRRCAAELNGIPQLDDELGRHPPVHWLVRSE